MPPVAEGADDQQILPPVVVDEEAVVAHADLVEVDTGQAIQVSLDFPLDLVELREDPPGDMRGELAQRNPCARFSENRGHGVTGTPRRPPREG